MAFVQAPFLTADVQRQGRTCALRRPQPRCSSQQPPASPTYIDDPYGGFKGYRRSKESDSWGDSGIMVDVHERSGTRLFTTADGALPSDAEVNLLVLPGWPSPSYLARTAVSRVCQLLPRARTLAIDWPGVGESDAPQDGIAGWSYSVDSALEAVRSAALHAKLDGLPLVIAAQGFLGTFVGVTLAQELNAAGLVLFTPAIGSQAHSLPKELNKLRNPLFGPLLTGNPAHMADKVFSSSTPYGIEEKTMMVLRSPFMRSGGPGFAARSTACNVDWKEAANDAAAKLCMLQCPVHIAITSGDKWLDFHSLKKEVDAFRAEANGDVQLTEWQYSGHFVFEDAPEDCGSLIADFMRSVTTGNTSA